VSENVIMCDIPPNCHFDRESNDES
jgi:hypothetical protein